RRSPMNQRHPDVQGAKDRDIQQDVGEVFVGDDRSVEAEDKNLFAKTRDVLEDAAQVGWFHVSPILVAHGLSSNRIGLKGMLADQRIEAMTLFNPAMQRAFCSGVPTVTRIHSGN